MRVLQEVIVAALSLLVKEIAPNWIADGLLLPCRNRSILLEAHLPEPHLLLLLEYLQLTDKFISVSNEIGACISIQGRGDETECILEPLRTVEPSQVEEMLPDEVNELVENDLPLVRPASVLEVIPELDKPLGSKFTLDKGIRCTKCRIVDRKVEEVGVSLLYLPLAHGDVLLPYTLLEGVEGQVGVELPVEPVELAGKIRNLGLGPPEVPHSVVKELQGPTSN
jgi:hypothetical protein